MPPTDRELAALKAKATSDQSAAPKPPRPGAGSTFTGPDPEEAHKIYRQILAGGEQWIRELIGLMRAPADPDFQNYKAEYLFHGLVVFAGAPGKENERQKLVQVIASQLANDKLSVGVRGFLIRELGWIGDSSVAPSVARQLTHEELCADAATTLVNLGSAASPSLRSALPRAQGKCRLVVLQSLAALGDTRSRELFQKALTDKDREVRLAAAWGLARLGDPASVDWLLKAADCEPGQERIKATQACLVLAEKLAASGQMGPARKIYTHLRDTRTDKSEKYIHDLANKALL